MADDSYDEDAEQVENITTLGLIVKNGGPLAVASALWLYLVCLEVDDRYLDEEFHVRQALVYADNRFAVWDPKITTPPGLYIVAYAWLYLLRTLRVPGSPEAHLRSLNTVGLVALWFVAWALSDAIQAERQPKAKKEDASAKQATDAATPEQLVAKRRKTTAHVALNVAVFPPLFFFCALFYTDVLSALFVLLAHLAFYRRQTFGVLVASFISLTFRQTNIFWTGVYLAGLEAQRQFSRLDTARRGRRKPIGLLSWSEVAHLSWNEGALYDPAAPEAAFEDYIKCGFSLAIATLANAKALILPLAPYVLLLASFAAFIIINGGVVLGDKSNHIASVHIPQMLYIWPCFAFFSFLVLLPNCFLVGAALVRRFVADFKDREVPDAPRLPRLRALAGFLVIALAAIYLNTIVHPFILADNRHYTFYVFRLLLRHPLIKFAVAPIYVLCGWLCLSVGATGFEAREKSSMKSVKTSVVLVWLLATTASLATAPLVEPRYFIIPWIIWRLNLHIPAVEDYEDWKDNDVSLANIERDLLGYETNWSVIVNLAVAYIFLFWHFEWPQQPGTIMRFMW